MTTRGEIDLTPEPEEIVQAEPEPLPVVPIATTVCGPVETRELPAVRAGYATAQGVGTQVAVRLLPVEPRRKAAVIIAQDQDIWISGTQAGAQMGAAAAVRVPAVVPFVIDHLDEVWACAVQSSTDISVMATYWSE